MEGFVFPVLSVIVFVPIVAAVIILFMNSEQRDLIRGVAIAAAATVLFLSGAVYFGYNAQVEGVVANQESILESETVAPGTEMFAQGLAFQEYVEWVPQLGIAYHVGVDGLSAPMVLLTGRRCRGTYLMAHR